MTHKWEPATQYNLNDKVRYHGAVYKIVQAHRSQSDWTPDVVPALWARVSNDGDSSSSSGSDSDDDRKKPHREHGNKHKHEGQHDKQQQPCMQTPVPVQAQPQPQAQPPAPAPPAPAPAPHIAKQYGDQDTNTTGAAAAAAQQQATAQVVPPNSNDPRKQEQDGFNIGSLHIGDDALKIGGGLLGTAAAIGIGAFAFDKYRDSKERKGDEEWSAQNWLVDARRRQGEYLEKIKADAHLPPVTWILTEGGAIPQGAIQAGQDAKTGQPYYIGRAYYNGGVWIGKAAASQGDGCHIAFGGKQVAVSHYEILLGYANAVRWIDGSGPLRNYQQYKMVEGGRTADGAPVYVAQTHCRNGSVVPGGVSEQGKGCYVAYDGDESIEPTYRYLTYA
ncbi:hypothetical protein HDU86_003256 [Geranomyces michiganensis]|nr:hypothetical protein HDU86_003256 [Geranomyces michiganensis]